MQISETDVLRIAELARLTLPADRITAVAAELSGILAHMGELQQVDTSDVLPVTGVGADGMPLRADSVHPPPMNTVAAALAPESRDGFILVPRLSTHEDL